jgi:DNA-binding response OmpR family regulator
MLSENMLSEKIWGDLSSVIDRNLRVNVMRLKQMLKPYGLDDWIRNVRGE